MDATDSDKNEKKPLANRTVGRFDPTFDEVSPGRRLRVFAALVRPGPLLFPDDYGANWWTPSELVEGTTYAELLRAAASETRFEAGKRMLSHLPLRVGVTGPLLRELPGEPARSRDPELHTALQDLGNEINEDIREALDTLDNPRAYYPGVDEGIEPVSDDHVHLAIWALQRELDRELRSAATGACSGPLPAAPLTALPHDVQRALVERRRLRFKQWGISKAEWEANDWSLWGVPEDGDYEPRRAVRLARAA